MEAAFINKNSLLGRPFSEAAATFFKFDTPNSAKVIFLQLFDCWAIKHCKAVIDISDQEIALFFDQLINLVAAAFILHQENRAQLALQKGNDSD